MYKLPREIWLMILEWKTKLERRERFEKALLTLEPKIKKLEVHLDIYNETEVFAHIFLNNAMIVEYQTLLEDDGTITNTIYYFRKHTQGLVIDLFTYYQNNSHTYYLCWGSTP